MLASQLLDGGGSERQMRQSATALNNSGFEVHVAFFRPDEVRELELRASGVQTVHIPLASFGSPSTLKVASQLWSYLRSHAIQLVHAFDAPTCTFVLPIARLAGTRVVLASQRGNRCLDSPTTSRLRWLSDAVSHGIVVNSAALAVHLESEGVPKEKIRFCPNGLDTKRFSPDGRRRLPELASASLVIGCVATHRPEKQLPFLVDSFADMRRQRLGLRLVLVGSGSERPKIEERIAAHQLGSDCLMIPHIADTAEILRSIDVFLLTSVSEGQSNSLMEAMATGCAVVGSNVEGTRDLIRDGVNGFLFEYLNQADLVTKTLALVDDEALRNKISADSSDWVRSTMSLEASAIRMAAIYEEYLGRLS